MEIALSLGYVPEREAGPSLSDAAPQDPTEALATLRRPEAPEAARHEAWAGFCRWLYREHGWAVGRLFGLIRDRGLAGRVEPGDVLAAFCLKVRADPGLLGSAPVPTRSWLWWRLSDTLRGLATEGREPPRALPARTAEPDAPVPEPPYPGGREPVGFGDPGEVAGLRELGRELRTELDRLKDENQDQYTALLLKAEHSYEDVARQMGRSENTVKSLVKRARDLIRARVARLSWAV